MILHQRNLLAQEVIVQENQILVTVVVLNLAVQWVPVQSHLVLLVLYLKFLSGLVGDGSEDFEVFFVVVEHLDTSEGDLFQVVAWDGEFFIKQVPVALFEAWVGEDFDDGELFGDDLFDVVLELMGDFQWGEVFQFIDDFGQSGVDFGDFGFALFDDKVTEFDVFPLSDGEIELFDEFPELIIGGDEMVDFDGGGEGGDGPLEVFFLMVEEGHFVYIFVGLIFVVLEVDEVLLVEFPDLKGVNFHTNVP